MIDWYPSGGKANTPTICDDAEFKNAMDQLEQTRRTVTAILIAFDMDQMELYRSRVSAVDPRVPNWSGSELRYGTHVSTIPPTLITQHHVSLNLKWKRYRGWSFLTQRLNSTDPISWT
jgi:hypothetical protein